MRYFQLILLLIITSTSIPGCVQCPLIDSNYTLVMQFDDYMISLAKAVDAVADKLPSNAQDEAIFTEVVKRSGNPNLLKPFEGYVLKARIQDGVGVILLCSRDGKEGIIEDVSCTTRPDTHRPVGSPCAYLLDVTRVCAEEHVEQ
jgi:hypothetical protein